LRAKNFSFKLKEEESFYRFAPLPKKQREEKKGERRRPNGLCARGQKYYKFFY